MGADPDDDHIRCLSWEGHQLEAFILTTNDWSISIDGRPGDEFPRLEFLDWSSLPWQLRWDGNLFQYYRNNAGNPVHGDSKMQYIGWPVGSGNDIFYKLWEVANDKATRKFHHTEGPGPVKGPIVAPV